MTKLFKQEEIDKAALRHARSYVEWDKEVSIDEKDLMDYSQFDFKAGVEFTEKEALKHIEDIIIENQGLKLYKDNEPKRFEELAIEFLIWIEKDYLKIPFKKDYVRITTNQEDWPYNFSKVSREELFNQFLKERNETKI